MGTQIHGYIKKKKNNIVGYTKQNHGYIEKQNNIIGYTKRKIIDIKVPKLDTKLTTAHVPIRDT